MQIWAQVKLENAKTHVESTADPLCAHLLQAPNTHHVQVAHMNWVKEAGQSHEVGFQRISGLSWSSLDPLRKNTWKLVDTFWVSGRVRSSFLFNSAVKAGETVFLVWDQPDFCSRRPLSQQQSSPQRAARSDLIQLFYTVCFGPRQSKAKQLRPSPSHCRDLVMFRHNLKITALIFVILC